MALQGVKRLNKNSLNKYSAVIFDLSGVLIDFGMHIPVIATSRAFNNYNIHIPEKNIREHNFKNQEQYIKATELVHTLIECFQKPTDDIELMKKDGTRMMELYYFLRWKNKSPPYLNLYIYIKFMII